MLIVQVPGHNNRWSRKLHRWWKISMKHQGINYTRLGGHISSYALLPFRVLYFVCCISVQIYSFPSCQLSRSLGELPGRVYQLCFHRSHFFCHVPCTLLIKYHFAFYLSNHHRVLHALEILTHIRDGEGKLAAAVGDGTARVWTLPTWWEKKLLFHHYHHHQDHHHQHHHHHCYHHQ